MPASQYIQQLLAAIVAEEKEEVQRYSLDQQHTLRSLKTGGLALHPIIITRKNFGYADYPEITFRLPFPADTNQFRDGAAIECFCAGEEPVKGMLISLDGKGGEFRLFAPDFPDWIEEDKVGIKLAPDQRTTAIMKKALNGLKNNIPLYHLFEQLHGYISYTNGVVVNEIEFKFIDQQLNDSQQQAVKAILQNENITIIHGPQEQGRQRR